MRNWCLDPIHLDIFANIATLEITHSQILDLPADIAHLFVEKKQAIEDCSLDILCDCITASYPEISFPTTPEKKRAWFLSPKIKRLDKK